MKAKNILILLSIVFVFFAASCENPLTGVESNDVIITGSLPDSDAADNKSGNINFTFNTVSDDLKDLVAQDQTELSRMYLYVKNYEINIKNSFDETVGTVSDSSSSIFGSSISASATGIPYGTGYYAEVRIFNPDVSSTVPVLIGTSPSFDLGQNDANVSVSLFPYNVIVLTDGDSASLNMVSSILDYSGAGQITSTGGEQWYSFTSAEGVFTLSMTPDSTSAPYAILWDASGNALTYSDTSRLVSGQYGYETILSLSGLDTDAIYYVGIVLFADAASNHSLSFEYIDGAVFADDAYEPNDSYNTAYQVTAGMDYYANIAYLGEEDYFTMSVTKEKYYIIDPNPYGDASALVVTYLLDSESWYTDSSLYASSDLDSDEFNEYIFYPDFTGEQVFRFAGYAGEYSFRVTEKNAPSPAFTFTPDPADISADVSFDGSLSSDGDEAIVSWNWDFGDGSTGSGETVSHTFSEVGDYMVSLTCIDSFGAGSTVYQHVLVNDAANSLYPPVADAGADQNIDTDTDGTVVYLDGSASSDTAPGSIASYSWTFYSYPNNSYYNPDYYLNNSSTATPSFDVDNIGGDPDSNGVLEYVLKLTVTDNDGATSSDFIAITVTGSSGLTVAVE